MNKQRRKALDAIREDITVLPFSDALAALDDCKAKLEELRDEEQDAFDNMPEGLQYSEKGEMAEAAVENLEMAMSEIEELTAITEKLDEVIGYIEEAQQ